MMTDMATSISAALGLHPDLLELEAPTSTRRRLLSVSVTASALAGSSAEAAATAARSNKVAAAAQSAAMRAGITTSISASSLVLMPGDVMPVIVPPTTPDDPPGIVVEGKLKGDFFVGYANVQLAGMLLPVGQQVQIVYTLEPLQSALTCPTACCTGPSKVDFAISRIVTLTAIQCIKLSANDTATASKETIYLFKVTKDDYVQVTFGLSAPDANYFSAGNKVRIENALAQSLSLLPGRVQFQSASASSRRATKYDVVTHVTTRDSAEARAIAERAQQDGLAASLQNKLGVPISDVDSDVKSTNTTPVGLILGIVAVVLVAIVAGLLYAKQQRAYTYTESKAPLPSLATTAVVLHQPRLEVRYVETYPGGNAIIYQQPQKEDPYAVPMLENAKSSDTLPNGWREEFDPPTGSVFYVNDALKEISMTRPEPSAPPPPAVAMLGFTQNYMEPETVTAETLTGGGSMLYYAEQPARGQEFNDLQATGANLQSLAPPPRHASTARNYRPLPLPASESYQYDTYEPQQIYLENPQGEMGQQGATQVLDYTPLDNRRIMNM